MIAVFAQFRLDDGAGADQAHLAPHNVPELGQLVEAGSPEEAPDRGDPRIIVEFVVFLETVMKVGRVASTLSASRTIVRNL